jgi:hypothetical protein
MAHLKPLLAFIPLILLAACASITPPQPPSLELPSPPSDLRAARKGHRVTLTWTVPTQTTDRQRVRSLGPTRICRGLEPVLKQCGTPAGETVASTPVKSATQKMEATYVDAVPDQLERDHPLEFTTYAVEVFNTNGRSAGLSNAVRVPLAPTLPAPRDLGAQVTAHGVVLTWAPGLSPSLRPQIQYVYRVYRRAEGSQESILIGELPVAGESSTRLTDPTIEWEETYYYRANATTVVTYEGGIEARVEGDDTPEIKVFAHDIFPPAVPSGVQAVYSGPGQRPFIDLIWAPVADVDLAGYNVYRREGTAQLVRINQDPIKTPAYRDSSVQPGKAYSYSISSVDVRGNESARSDEASESVP